MVTIRWNGLEAFVRPGLGFRIVRHTNGWYVYFCGDRLDDIGYETEDDAKAAAEAVVDELDAVTPLPPVRKSRTFVDNQGPEPAPHPGRLRRPPW